MPLAVSFIFSANNLQDYLDCPRRFELRYILKQNWPAITSQPVMNMEKRMLMGNRFHLVAHQYLLGISAETLRDTIDDPDLGIWFVRFQEYINQYLSFNYFCEFSVIMPFEGYRLMAVFDFITYMNTTKIRICDWKTTSLMPSKEKYLQSVQTSLYTFLAYETRVNIFSQSSESQYQDLAMEYWFPNFPEIKIIHDHSAAIHENSRAMLSSLVSEISQIEQGDFKKTSNEKKCAFCQYRSLCERGIQAGANEEAENGTDSDWIPDDLNFDQIDEIAF